MGCAKQNKADSRRQVLCAHTESEGKQKNMRVQGSKGELGRAWRVGESMEREGGWRRGWEERENGVEDGEKGCIIGVCESGYDQNTL